MTINQWTRDKAYERAGRYLAGAIACTVRGPYSFPFPTGATSRRYSSGFVFTIRAKV